MSDERTLQTRSLPHEISFGPLITVPYKNKLTSFIFGSMGNRNIYRYIASNRNYEYFDEYRQLSFWTTLSKRHTLNLWN